MDARACYTAMASAHMLGLDAPGLAREAGMADFLRRCQARSLATASGNHPPTCIHGNASVKLHFGRAIGRRNISSPAACPVYQSWAMV